MHRGIRGTRPGANRFSVSHAMVVIRPMGLNVRAESVASQTRMEGTAL
jgi:hypothetical protein